MANFYDVRLSTIIIEQPDHTMMIGLPNQVQKNEEINQVPIQSLNQNIESIERNFQIARQEPIFNVRAETVYITPPTAICSQIFQIMLGLILCFIFVGFIFSMIK